MINTTDGDKKQDVIVRFKSHSARYALYEKRGDLKKKTNNKIRITPSLTSKRRKLLSTARQRYEENELVDFIFCNIHGDIKVKTKSDINNKLFHTLTCIEDLEKLLGITDENDDEM